ncbi:isochorismatase family protein [Streptomyces sp. APSN-46.1]|uniref:isochorismatase family protein n=1 Tax=Streptomyces sp. APSN-46.1 TaxID=2929049 RepID=UPI001FB466D9|nr:isochorismatase family protein [Streptomyces sp. APSN-46.1]MCJ1680419.1 isochorismatase family protein [Streptomyces sp. APSN-46.1]
MAGIPAIAPYPLPTRSSLPENTADWTLRQERAVLVIHDMQHFFLRPVPEPLRSEVVHNAALLRKRAASLGVPVAYTAQPGGMTEEQRGLLRDFWGPGMRTAPDDREVVPELAPDERDWTLTKWRYSAFFRSDLLERMRAAGRDQLVICGVYAHVGILATAVDAFTHDIQPFLVADAVADFSADEHRLAVDYVAQRCGMSVLSEEVFV